jgi:hypothetical protein
MEREFTNVSYAKPLWNYAIEIYSVNKCELLRFQDTQQLCVNDILMLGFCLQGSLVPADAWWQNPSTVKVREITTRLRALRNDVSNSVLRPTILELELECEKIDLMLLAQTLTPGKLRWPSLFRNYCLAHTVTDPTTLRQFIFSLSTKKGAEAP